MKCALAPVIMAAVVVVGWGGQARTAPQPSEVPVDWELTFQYKDLQPMQVHVPGEPSPRLFWYLRYAVTNRTGKDQIYIPSFELYTRTGQLIRAGENVPTYVFEHIREVLNDPFIKDASEITGKLLQGEDNAKDGLAIWPDFDPSAGTIKLFIGGLSGETAEVQLPRPVRVREMDVDGRIKEVIKTKLILSKTLQLTYEIPGQKEGRLRAPIKFVGKKWIMR